MGTDRQRLRAAGITKSFAGVRALRGVDFDLRAGEVHALVGENGAGKSTLIKVITGAHAPDEGTLEIDGQPVDRFDPARARALGVAAIYQQPALFPDLTVAENIAIGLEPGGPWRWIDWGKRRRHARELLDLVGSTIGPDRDVRTLSMPEQQLVEIARALGADARILILDEPTASLSDREVENLLRVVLDLKSRGVGLLYISHRLEELGRIADRVTVLRDGQTVGTLPMAEADRPTLIRLMIGRELSAIFPKIESRPGEIALELRDLGCSAGGVHGVSLVLRRGEIVGLAGLVGAGRTELAEAIFGLTPADSGSIRRDGREVRIDRPEAAIALGIGHVPEDRRRHGVIPEMPVASNASLAILDRLGRGPWLDRRAERALASDYVAKLAIKTPTIDAPAGNLSGGNQQKVAVARWLATRPEVLILDEPTQGVDIGAKAEIHRLISGWAAEGLAILIISSELPEILGMSDRILVMRGGTIVGELARDEASPERVLALALGHSEAEVSPG
ncbi:MAG: sugar ABC transporter ATP-binding protein [Isosphaeraceae bacterium]